MDYTIDKEKQINLAKDLLADYKIALEVFKNNYFVKCSVPSTSLIKVSVDQKSGNSVERMYLNTINMSLESSTVGKFFKLVNKLYNVNPDYAYYILNRYYYGKSRLEIAAELHIGNRKYARIQKEAYLAIANLVTLEE